MYWNGLLSSVESKNNMWLDRWSFSILFFKFSKTSTDHYRYFINCSMQMTFINQHSETLRTYEMVRALLDCQITSLIFRCSRFYCTDISIPLQVSFSRAIFTVFDSWTYWYYVLYWRYIVHDSSTVNINFGNDIWNDTIKPRTWTRAKINKINYL